MWVFQTHLKSKKLRYISLKNIVKPNLIRLYRIPPHRSGTSDQERWVSLDLRRMWRVRKLGICGRKVRFSADCDFHGFGGKYRTPFNPTYDVMRRFFLKLTVMVRFPIVTAPDFKRAIASYPITEKRTVFGFPVGAVSL